MAIVDMKGTVSKEQPSMTGMVNQTPTTVDAPQLSGMNKLFDKKQVAQKPMEDAPVQRAQTVEAPSDDLIAKVQNLTNEDKAVLSTVLSPSVSKVLGKIAPDLNPLLTQFTKDEENVVLPVSIVKNFASNFSCVTNGEKGVFFLDDDDLVQLKPPKIDAKDTLAAGDVWHGAFTYAVSIGTPIVNACKYANLAASKKCENFICGQWNWDTKIYSIQDF